MRDHYQDIKKKVLTVLKNSSSDDPDLAEKIIMALQEYLRIP